MAKYQVHVPVRIITEVIEVEAEDRDSARNAPNGTGVLVRTYTEKYNYQGGYYVTNVDGKDPD